ncbi:MAG: tetratricopeptide repeat protein, partial [Deltaproteobacteria bacterium]|nr:tetratricopeptide repeat protein [Deltaproteobacteria bacterium]
FKPWDAWNYHHMQGWRNLLQGDLKQASFHIELAFKFSEDVGAFLSMISCHSMKANLMHRLGKEREAEEHLGHAFNIADQVKSRFFLFCGLLIKALFALDRGDEMSAESSLRKALLLGKEERYFYTGINQPSGLARLCVKALEAGIEVEYVQELIRKLNVVPLKPAFLLENWPWPLKIFSLGRFELLKDGKPIQFARKVQQKPLAMLKALVAFGGKKVREDQMVDALWPESDGDMAHQSFETTLHRLRQLTGIPDAIIRKEGSLTLDQRYWWVDTWAFEHLVREVDAAWRKEEKEISLEEAVSLNEKAIGLYQGTFLPKETLEPWADSVRERLRNKFLRCVERLGHHWEASGEWEKAVECYEQGLEADDLIEEFYQHLMICFQKLGQVTKALSVYKRCKKTISAGLGVSLSSRTEAIYRALIMNR